jgi:pimeloyl-ACP methyl ester carboxylesterase
LHQEKNMSYQFVDINGTEIHYEVRGQGTAVVLIHAGNVNMGMWDAQMEALTEKHTVMRYDIRGWGESANVLGEYSNHEDLRGLLAYLDIDRATIVGCSWGGKIGLDFALTYPEMVRGLVLVGTGLGGYAFTMTGIEQKIEALGEAYEQDNKVLMAEIITQLWFDGPHRSPKQVDKGLRAKAYEMVLHTISIPETEGSQELDLDPPAIERLGEIAVPTMLLAGQEDAQDIFMIAEVLEAELPSVEALITIPKAAHMPNMERPSVFNRLVLDFIERIESA